MRLEELIDLQTESGPEGWKVAGKPIGTAIKRGMAVLRKVPFGTALDQERSGGHRRKFYIDEEELLCLLLAGSIAYHYPRCSYWKTRGKLCLGRINTQE